jgi:putative flippase GtrA
MWQLIRYGVVGLLINLILYLAYILITHYGIEPKKAMTVIYIFGVSIGFFGHRKWTFIHTGNNRRTIFRFVLSHFAGFMLNFLLLSILVDRLGFSHQVVQAVSVLIVAAFLFIAFKFFVFSGATSHVVNKNSV